MPCSRNLVGELRVGQGAGQLQRAYRHGVQRERLAVRGLRILGSQAAGDFVQDDPGTAGVGVLCSGRAAPDLVEQGGGGASGAGVVPVLRREVFAQELLQARPAGRQFTETLRLGAHLVGDDAGDEIVLGREMSVERAVGQPRVRHQRGHAGAVDAVGLEPMAGRVEDPLPRRLLVLLAVTRHRDSSIYSARPMPAPNIPDCMTYIIYSRWLTCLLIPVRAAGGRPVRHTPVRLRRRSSGRGDLARSGPARTAGQRSCGGGMTAAPAGSAPYR